MPNEQTSSAPRRADAQRNRALILAAAERVFGEHGAAGSTEEVARQAGVAVGTVFRHFATKQELLAALVKELLERLRAEAERLTAEGDPGTALFAFFSYLVAEAAEKRTVVELLADVGTSVPVDAVITGFTDALTTLLSRAQYAGSVRTDVTVDDILALLIGTTQGAVRSGWDRHRQERVLSIVFDGLAAHDHTLPRPRSSGSGDGL